MTDYMGKTIKLGDTDNVVTIKGIKGDMYITDEETLKDILVPVNSINVYGVDGVDYISLPADVKPEKEVEMVDIIPETDYTDSGVYVTIKNRGGEYKVVKTTKKTIHFIEDDKKRYVNLIKVKKAWK